MCNNLSAHDFEAKEPCVYVVFYRLVSQFCDY
jgi:hypothetical protein